MPVPVIDRHAKKLPALIVVLCCALAIALFVVWRALYLAEQEQARARLQLESDALAHQIEAHFRNQTETLLRLAKRWPLHSSRRDLWNSDVEQLLHDFPSFQAIEWLDRNYRMQWVEPLAGNEAAANLVYQPTHPNYPVLLSSGSSGRPQLSNAFTLAQGGLGLAYYVPLYLKDGEFDGFLIGIFRVEVLLNDLVQHLHTEPMNLRLLENEKMLFSTGATNLPGANWNVGSPVHLGGNNDFRLLIYPSQQLLERTTTSLPALVTGTSTLIAILLCCSLWLAVRGAQRNRLVNESNRRLQAEITRRQKTEETLKQSQAHMRLVNDMTDNSHDALFIISLAPLEIVYLNRTCWQGLGYTEQELRNLVQVSPTDVIPDAAQWLADLRKMLEREGDAIFQRRVMHRDGHSVPLEVSVRHIRRMGRDYLICVGRNNSEQLQIAEQLQRLSHQDGLTGLFNRRHFDDTILREWRRLRREQAPLGLLMLDVDYFKRFNDELGHQAGDDALRQLAAALNRALTREGDCICRYGGEEFAVILPGADASQCLQAAGRVHEAVAKIAIHHPKTSVASGLLTVSIGAASLIPASDKTPDELIRQADLALYQAKTNGRNRTELGDETTTL